MTFRAAKTPLTALALLLGQQVAWAADDVQQSPAAEQQADAPDQDIIVTARLRSESLSKVPDSITAFSSTMIAERGLTGLSEYLALMPNTKIVQEQDLGTSEVYIRGVGSNKGQAPSVAFVLDGVVLPDSDAFTVDLSDAEQVEILKGPQGALYGKGALAGAVVVRTRKPTDQFEGEIKLGAGSFDTYSIYGRVGGPIAGSGLLGQITMKYSDTDGPYKNAYNGKPLWNDKSFKLAGRLIADLGGTITAEIAGTYVRQRAGNPPYTAINLLNGSGREITSAQAKLPIAHDGIDKGGRDVYIASLIINADLGFGTLTSTTAYDKTEISFLQDLDFLALNVAEVNPNARSTRSFSQELRLTSNDEGPFTYVLTGYYQDTRRNTLIGADLDLCFLGVFPCPTPPGVESGMLISLPIQDTRRHTKSWAVAAQGNLAITSNLDLTLALRYDRDTPVELDVLHGNIRRKATFDDWQPKASLSYRPTDNLTLYTTYAHGYKSGAFNNVAAGNPIFKEVVSPEKTDNIEAGIKGRVPEAGLTFTAAAFHTNYKNSQQFQVDLSSGGNQIINVAKTKIWGLEADVTFRPVRSWVINGSVGYTKSNIRDFNGTGAFIGQSLPYQPRYSFNLGTEYRIEAGDWKIVPRIDYSRQGKTSFQDFQNPNPNEFLYQKNSENVDARISLTRDNISFAFYGKNIFNTRYAVSAYSRYISSLIFVPLNRDFILPSARRSFGIEARATF